MKEPLISVIVPVYNVERYLAACLDSIISQSYRNLEIIIIVDGATDFSGKIAETYSEKEDRITVYNYPNEGLAESRNRGLEVATGDYIVFVDSDDLLLPDALKTLMRVMQENNVDLVEGKIVKEKPHNDVSPVINLKTVSFTPIEAIADVLYQKMLLPSAAGKIFKRFLFDGLRFEKGIFYEDLNIFYRILERCNKIIWVNFPVYFYRTNEDSITNIWKAQRLDVLKITENLENYINEKYPEILPAAKDRRLSANFNMFALCSIHGDYDNANKCWAHIRQHRKNSFFNKNVRFKNKAGILLSYLGKNVFNLAARRIYK